MFPWNSQIMIKIKQNRTINIERSIFQTFWKGACCANFFVFWVRELKFWLLAFFLIFFNCAKFQKDWTNLVLNILYLRVLPLMFFFVIYQKREEKVGFIAFLVDLIHTQSIIIRGAIQGKAHQITDILTRRSHPLCTYLTHYTLISHNMYLSHPLYTGWDKSWTWRASRCQKLYTYLTFRAIDTRESRIAGALFSIRITCSHIIAWVILATISCRNCIIIRVIY